MAKVVKKAKSNSRNNGASRSAAAKAPRRRPSKRDADAAARVPVEHGGQDSNAPQPEGPYFQELPIGLGDEYPLLIDFHHVHLARKPPKMLASMGYSPPSEQPTLPDGWPPVGWKTRAVPASDSPEAIGQWVEWAISYVDRLSKLPHDDKWGPLFTSQAEDLLSEARLLRDRVERNTGRQLLVELKGDKPVSYDLIIAELRAFEQCVTGSRNSPVDLERELTRLEAETPPWDASSKEWVCVKDAAKHEGITAETLKKYRSQGIQTAGKMLGRDPYGRCWRRPGSPTARPWYWLPSLRGQS